MDLTKIENFQLAFWTYYEHIYNTILLTGEPFSNSVEEVQLFLKVADAYVDLEKDIVIQLSNNSKIAPTFLQYIQIFLDKVYRNVDHHCYNESFRNTGKSIPLHPAIDELQICIEKFSQVHKVELNVFTPKNNKGLETPTAHKQNPYTDKEKIANRLFPADAREFVDEAIRYFKIIDEFGRCNVEKGVIRGFVLAMTEHKYIYKHLDEKHKMILFQQYINEPKPTRIHEDTQRSENTMKEVIEYIISRNRQNR